MLKTFVLPNFFVMHCVSSELTDEKVQKKNAYLIQTFVTNI